MKTKILILFLALVPAMTQAQVNYAISGNTAYVAGSPNASGNVVITNTYDGYPVTSIGDEAFYGDGLTSVTIPNSVTNIGGQAFADCHGLTSVTIPNSVTSIGGQAFGFSGLTSVTIPDSVSSIGGEAFYESGLTNVTIGNSVTSIGDNAFASCSGLHQACFQGNAPLVDGGAGNTNSTVFEGDSGTVYYSVGTSGWSGTYGGWPAVELDGPPQIGGGGGIGIQSGNFGFTITGASNQTVTVEASTNLVNWQPVWINTLSGKTTNFTDGQWKNFPMRFYRAACVCTVGGTLSGLPAGDTVTLQDNGSDNLTLSTNGTFTFPTALPNGHAYSVTVSGTSGGTPTICTLTNGSGTISGANVTNLAVQCMSVPTCPALTGDMDLDMYNAAVSDGTANGGVPGVMLTTVGGPFRVTAPGTCSVNVALVYSEWAWFDTVVGSDSCSSTTFPSGAVVIAFGSVLECGFGPFGY